MTTTQYATSGVSTRTNVYAERTMLSHALPVMVLEVTALNKSMPKNKTETIEFRRPIPFTASTTPLSEGVTPTARVFTYEDVSGTLEQYADLVEITDKIQDLHEDPVLKDASMICGENIGRTEEALCWATVRAGTNVLYTNGSARSDVNTPFSLTKARAATRFLKQQKGMKFTNILDGSQKFNTRPVEAAFIAVGHTNLESDIRNLPKFTPVAEYGSRQPISPHEIGTCEDVRYILSPDLAEFADAGGAKAGSGTTMVSTTGTSADVYPLMFFAKEAWAKVALRGQGSISPTIIPPGKVDKSDPLGQRGYVGWKMWHLSMILNDAWMIRVECAATDL